MTVADLHLRAATATDAGAVLDALMWAVNWSPERPPLGRDQVLAAPGLAHYATGWPRPGDLGVVAVVPGAPARGDGVTAPEELVGAAWLRSLPADDPGYGFVADGVPELSIGVRPGSRGRGTGRRLLRELLATASAAGIGRVSLSVERANRARALYLAEGFTVVGGDADADTLVADLVRLRVDRTGER